MHGNVQEWCQDWYDSYSSVSIIDPVGTKTGTYRTIRGGSWHTNAQFCRSANRTASLYPSDRNYSLGFRLVRLA